MEKIGGLNELWVGGWVGDLHHASEVGVGGLEELGHAEEDRGGLH